MRAKYFVVVTLTDVTGCIVRRDVIPLTPQQARAILSENATRTGRIEVQIEEQDTVMTSSIPPRHLKPMDGE